MAARRCSAAASASRRRSGLLQSPYPSPDSRARIAEPFCCCCRPLFCCAFPTKILRSATLNMHPIGCRLQQKPQDCLSASIVLEDDVRKFARHVLALLGHIDCDLARDFLVDRGNGPVRISHHRWLAGIGLFADGFGERERTEKIDAVV